MNPLQPEFDKRKAQPTSRSIFRGHGETGKGENPTSTVPHGQQYLDSDPELWAGPLPDLIRPWMTLDDRAEDRWTLGEKIEGWSYFTAGSLTFVVRLAAAGSYRDRTVYFSHGRAWRTADCFDNFDPGALIGWKAAFDEPWRGVRPAPGNGASADKSTGEILERVNSVWRDAVKKESDAAVQFLAHLYESRRASRPLVIAAPIQDFVESSPLYHLIGFARAALPVKMKKDCRIRIYTSQPGVALSAWKCDLIAIPEELAPDALTARRDAMLLDRQGRNLSGRKADTSYAESVVDRMGVFPRTIFAFSERVDRIPPQVSAAAVPIVYNLAVVFPGSGPIPVEDESTQEIRKGRDSLLGFLRESANQQTEVMPWDLLIQAEEWNLFSEDAVNEAAFFQPLTPNAAKLRGEARLALVRYKQLNQGRLVKWWASVSDDRRLEELQELVRLRLIPSPEASALFVLDLTPKQVEDLLPNPDHHAVLLLIAGTPRWAAAVADNVANLPYLVALAGKSAWWGELAFRCVEQLVASGQIPPDRGACLQLLAFPDPSADDFKNGSLERYLLLTEALLITGQDRMAEERIGNLRAISNPDLQHSLLSGLWNKNNSRALRRYFAAPRSWFGSVGDLLLQRRELIAKLDVGDMLDLVPGTAQLPEAIRGVLDAKMRSEQRDHCTEILCQKRAWMRWRLETGLHPDDLRNCALAWLYSDHKLGPDLEEWKRVLVDLGDLRPGDLSGMPKEPTSAGWPFIPLFEPEQRRDLAQACPDLGIVAALAESFDRWDRPAYEEVMSASRFSQKPAGLVLLLSSRADLRNTPLNDFSWEDIGSLYEMAGDRKAWAQAAASRKVLLGLRGDFAHARDLAKKCQLRDSPEFLRLLDEERRRSPDVFSLSYVRSWLDVYVPPAAPASLKPAPSPLYAALIRALRDGLPGDTCWEGFMDDAGDWQAGPPAHPFRQLAQAIRVCPDRDLERIDQKGWSTFQRVCFLYRQRKCTLRFLRDSASLLELAGVLTTKSLGVVAAEVAVLASELRFDTQFLPGEKNWYDDQYWWRDLIEATKRCPRRSGQPGAFDRAESAMTAVLRVLDACPSSFGPRRDVILRETVFSQRQIWTIPIGEQSLEFMEAK
jgi:hypothetical protein